MISRVLVSGDSIGVSTNTTGGILIQLCDGTHQTRVLLSTREALDVVTKLVQAVSKTNEMQRHDRQADPKGLAEPS